jgi:sugar/nucleoside kinase (ribokinase family)
LDISSLSGVEVLKADREELAGWTGLKDVDASVHELSKFVNTILLTSGPGEVDAYQGGKRIMRARPPTVEPKDTTGAGDIMLASFAAKYSETGNCEESLAFSVCAASLAVRKVGVEKGILDRGEVLRHSRKIVITHG